MHDLLLSLKDSTFFCQIDLNMGYHQIPISEDRIKLTAFVLPFGHFEFLRLPFGLNMAPRAFQRTMQEILGHLPYI